MFERPTDLHTPVRKRFDAGTLTPRRLNFDMEKLALLASASAHEEAHSNAEATAIVPDESRPLASAFAPVPLDEDSEQQMLMQALCASLQEYVTRIFGLFLTCSPLIFPCFHVFHQPLCIMTLFLQHGCRVQ